jgi:hypothetical protein
MVTLKPPFAGTPNLIAPAPGSVAAPGNHTPAIRHSGGPSAFLAMNAVPASRWFRWLIKPLGCALGYLILVAMFSMIGLWAIGWE